MSILAHPAVARKLDVLKAAFTSIYIFTGSEEFASAGYVKIPLKTASTLGQYFGIIMEFLELINLTRGNIVVLSFDMSLKGLLALCLAKLTRVPFVSFFVVSPSPVYGPLTKLRLSYGLFLRTSEFCITLSPVLTEHLLRVWPGAHLLHLPNRADDDFRNHNKERVPGAVIHVGRFVPEKRLDAVLRTFGRVRDIVPNAVLYLVGDGPCYPSVKKLATRLGLDDCVIFLGYVDKRTMIDWLNRASAFFFASDTETCPNAVIEALSCGLPIVSSDTPELRWLIGNAGLFAPPSDEAESARLLCELLTDDTLRTKLSSLATERAAALNQLHRVQAQEVIGNFVRLQK